jgi:hypothetical protein
MATWDKTTIIVSAVVGSLGVLSVSLGVAAEAQLVSITDQRATYLHVISIIHNHVILERPFFPDFAQYGGPFPARAVPQSRAGNMRWHLPDGGTDHRRRGQRMLRVLQVPRHFFRDQADRRHRVRHLLVVRV